MVTRLDVPAKSQVLSMLQMLFFIFCEGVTDSAFLMIFLAFSPSLVDIEILLNEVEKEDNDSEDDNVEQANVENAEAFLEDDYVPLNEDMDKPKKSSSALLLSKSRSLWQSMRESEKQLLIKGGGKLQSVINDLVPATVFGGAITAFDRYDLFRRNTSFGAKSNRAKVSDDLMRSGASIGTIRSKLFKGLLICLIILAFGQLLFHHNALLCV